LPDANVKRKTFYHLCLSLPYIALLISGAFIYFAQGLDFFSSPDPSPSILSGLLAFFTLSAILWAPLYTWMVVVMLFWGRWKNTEEIRRMYILSPALLACAMGFPALLAGMPNTGLFLLWGLLHMNNLDYVMPILFENYSLEEYLSIGLAWAFMAALCIVIGYVFVGCALLIERFMKRRGLFIEEEPSGEILPLLGLKSGTEISTLEHGSS
jgi:hypothetical protein